MTASLRKFGLAAVITLGAATAATLGSGIVHSQPAEAGIISTIKGAAKTTVKYTAGGVAHWAKQTAGGAKYAASKTIVPMAKGVKQGAVAAGTAIGKPIVRVVAPIVRKAIEKIKNPPRPFPAPWRR